MAWGNSVTVVGNLTRDPELRFTNSGMAVGRLTVAFSKRGRDGQGEKTSFFDVVMFREMAENAAESLTKGMRVVVTGEIQQNSWENDQGEKRSKIEILADDIGPSLRWASADVQKNERREGEYQPNQGGGGSRPQPGTGPAFNPDEEPF
ncbi:MAG: single-stranded DNA-binding protein [Actinomycetota bacterium]